MVGGKLGTRSVVQGEQGGKIENRKMQKFHITISKFQKNGENHESIN